MSMTPEENNRLMRELLIRNSPKILKKLPTVTGVLGGTTRVKLNNTGLITRLFVDVQIPYTTTVAPTNITQKGIWAAIPKVQLIDFDGTTRVNTSSYLLNILNTMRGRQANGGAALLQSQSGLTSVSTAQSNVIRHPQIDSLVGAKTLRIMFEVPVAADVMNGDLRGMIPAQFVSGDLQLALDFASSLTGTTNDDFVFNGGTFSVLGAPTVTVYQEYYFPQKIRGVTAIPQQDISTVYEVGVYSRTTDNLAAGQEKLVNFPIVREVNGLVIDYISATALGGASAANDLQQFTVYANGNNIMYQADQYLQNILERNALGTDLPQGTFMLDFAAGPISTAIFGNVQLAVTPGATVTTPALEVCFESIYAKGSALSGAPV